MVKNSFGDLTDKRILESTAKFLINSSRFSEYIAHFLCCICSLVSSTPVPKYIFIVLGSWGVASMFYVCSCCCAL